MENMMRRLIQTPAHRQGRRNISTIRKAPDSRPTVGGSSRCSSGDAAQLDGDTSSVCFTPPPPPPIRPRTRGFEIQGISRRHLSSEAIRPLSLSSEGGGVMLNPFLNTMHEGGHVEQTDFTEDSLAYLGLFKAISTLNGQPTPTPASYTSSSAGLSILNAEDDDDDEVIIDDNAGDAKQSHEYNEEEEKDNDNSLDFTGVSEMAKEDGGDIELQKHRIKCVLGQAFAETKKDPNRSHKTILQIFNEVRTSPHAHELLDDELRRRIFRYLVNIDVASGFEVLKYHATRCRADGGRLVSLDLYTQLFQRLFAVEIHYENNQVKSTLLSNNHNFNNNNNTHRSSYNNNSPQPMDAWEWKKLVEGVNEHIRKEYSEGKEMVYQYLLLPALVDSLTEKRDPFVNRCAKPIMEYIMHCRFPLLDPEVYERVLGRAMHNKVGPDYIPYQKVLSYLVSNGHRPKPETVNNVLQCYFPFTDIEAMHEILVTIQILHPVDDATPLPSENYSIDLGTLESISVLAARKNVNLNLLVWDLVELFDYKPTQSMFEDVIMSFAATKQDLNLYSAMVDMEKHGFVPPGALLKYVAIKLGFADNRLLHSKKVLTWHENEHLRSTHSMNTLLMAYGMKRKLNSAFFIFEEMGRFHIQPDVNTFTFLMEALYIDIKDKYDYRDTTQSMEYNADDVENVFGATQIILDSMEEASIEKTKFFFHAHIRLLISLSKLEDAYAVLDEAISSGTGVTVGTLFILGNRFAQNGQYERAYDVAGLSAAAGCGDNTNLAKSISKIQRNARIDGNGPTAVE